MPPKRLLTLCVYLPFYFLSENFFCGDFDDFDDFDANPTHVFFSTEWNGTRAVWPPLHQGQSLRALHRSREGGSLSFEVVNLIGYIVVVVVI